MQELERLDPRLGGNRFAQAVNLSSISVSGDRRVDAALVPERAGDRCAMSDSSHRRPLGMTTSRLVGSVTRLVIARQRHGWIAGGCRCRIGCAPRSVESRTHREAALRNPL